MEDRRNQNSDWNNTNSVNSATCTKLIFAFCCLLAPSCGFGSPNEISSLSECKKTFPLDMKSFRNFQPKILAEWKATQEPPSRESWNPRWHRKNQNVSKISCAVESGKDTRRWTSYSKQRFSFAYNPSHKFNQRTALLLEDQSAISDECFYYE